MDHEAVRPYFERALALSREALAGGNDPFATILVDPEGTVLMEQKNDVAASGPTAHDTNTLIARASREYDPEFLWNCTVYAAMEPCCMCTGAAFWANIGHVRYLMSERQLGEITGPGGLDLPSTEVVAAGNKEIRIEGPYPPLLEEMESLMRQWVASWGA